ncbi:MAG: dGTP triphosphohydrolase [Aureliella sp.]
MNSQINSASPPIRRGDIGRGAARASEWKHREALLLASYAMFGRDSTGRRYDEEPHPYRGPFQRDRDRILHSAAFRRLSGKMQVFTGDMGDYHRTRLTHTHEVATIARTIGRVLRLNEDLIEALALLHDIGHPPYGHSGEDALRECLRDHGGFSHNRFALTLVEELETRYTPYPGLNLSQEVLAGQGFRIDHGGAAPLLEVQVVDLADSLAYNAHDVDDALALGLIRFQQLQGLELVQRALDWGQTSLHAQPQAIRQSLVHSLIDVQVADVLDRSLDALQELAGLDSLSVRQLETKLALSPPLASEREQLAQFLFDNVYRHDKLITVRQSAATRVRRLFERLVANANMLPPRFVDRAQRVGVPLAVGAYLAGMTDRYCDQQYRQLIELGATSAADW